MYGGINFRWTKLFYPTIPFTWMTPNDPHSMEDKFSVKMSTIQSISFHVFPFNYNAITKLGDSEI